MIFLTMVLFFNHLGSSVSDQDLYVTVDGSLCPDYATVCESLSFYYENLDKYFVDNTTFYFLEGLHSLSNRTITISEVTNVRFHGMGAIVYEQAGTVTRSSSVLKCSQGGMGGILFDSCKDIQIINITIMNCSSLNSKASLAIYNSEIIYLEGISILYGQCYGLLINNTHDVILKYSSFYQNSGSIVSEFWSILVAFPDFSLFSESYLHIDSTNISSSGFGGLMIVFQQQNYYVDVSIVSSKLVNNVQNAQVSSYSACQYTLGFYDIVCSDSKRGGILIQQLQNCYEESIAKHYIIIRNSNFMKNIGATFTVFWTSNDNGHLSIISTNFTRNTGTFGSALRIEQNSNPIVPFFNHLEVELLNSRFEYNSRSEDLANAADLNIDVLFTVGAINIQSILINNCCFHENFGTALVLLDSVVTFVGVNEFYNNSGIFGGAVCLYSNSYMILKETSITYFFHNVASIFGGAIFIDQFLPRIYQAEGSSGIFGFCFYHIDHQINNHQVTQNDKNLVFQSNQATYGGSAVYGGISQDCLSLTTLKIVEIGFLQKISSFINQTGNSVISSKALGVCFCNNSVIDCSAKSVTIKAFPGNSINISLVPVGNENGATPGLIDIRDKRFKLIATFSFGYPLCYNVPHLLQVNDPDVNNETLYIIAHSEYAVSNILIVDVVVLPCPTGYYLSYDTGVCECSPAISKSATCYNDPMLIGRAGSVWIGYDDQLNCTIVNSNCPFDYCIFADVNVSIMQPSIQCRNGRIGRLCGACPNNESLVLGSNSCMYCKNHANTLILIWFALAGILLVAFLFFLNLTVSAGTINGLIFYANVIKIYEPLLVTNKIPFLSQFISWINLDFGINVCFCDGLNACGKHALQFVFPIYLWLIILAIIVASKYSNKLAKLIGNDGIPVLATLILLSFTKLLRTVVFTFSISKVSCNTEENTQNQIFYYWYIDPTQKYIKGCHLALVLASIVVFLFLILPYILFLLFYPLLQMSCVKVRQRMSWFLFRCKPFFDAYRGPHSDVFAFWPGMLLIVRIILAVVVAMAANNDIMPHTVLLLVSLLLISILSFGKVYSKKIYLHSLDIVLLVGLTFFAYLLNASYKEDNSGILMYGKMVVDGLSVIVFIIVFTYHFLKMSIVGKYLLRLFKKTTVNSGNSDEPDNNNEQNVAIEKNDENDFETSLEIPIKTDFSKYRESVFSIN